MTQCVNKSNEWTNYVDLGCCKNPQIKRNKTINIPGVFSTEFLAGNHKKSNSKTMLKNEN